MHYRPSQDPEKREQFIKEQIHLLIRDAIDSPSGPLERHTNWESCSFKCGCRLLWTDGRFTWHHCDGQTSHHE